MSTPSYLTKSITIRGVDGNDIRVSETAERQAVVISIQQNDDGGRIASVRLDQAQFDALCHTRYSMDFDKPAVDSELQEVA
ncbi:MAG: hypothetical protein IT165_25410 [Bryobacterales bacterium]|nr:hypothetical protein [Bryobacterales bacterium]